MQLAIVVCQMWQKFFPLVENRTSNPSNIPEYTSMQLECPISEPNSALEIHGGFYGGPFYFWMKSKLALVSNPMHNDKVSLVRFLIREIGTLLGVW